MALPYLSSFIPNRRRGVEVLLESVDWNLDFLTDEQLAACRFLYFLDTDLSVADLVRMGRLLP